MSLLAVPAVQPFAQVVFAVISQRYAVSQSDQLVNLLTNACYLLIVPLHDGPGETVSEAEMSAAVRKYVLLTHINAKVTVIFANANQMAADMT